MSAGRGGGGGERDATTLFVLINLSGNSTNEHDHGDVFKTYAKREAKRLSLSHLDGGREHVADPPQSCRPFRKRPQMMDASAGFKSPKFAIIRKEDHTRQRSLWWAPLKRGQRNLSIWLPF